MGAAGCPALIEQFEIFAKYKIYYLIVCLAVMSLTCGLASNASTLYALLGEMFCQGLALGGFDTICNCLLPEIWLLRVQPWMQCLHASFGVGAIVGALLVGSIGFTATFQIIAVICILPVLFIVFKSQISSWVLTLIYIPVHVTDQEVGYVMNPLSDSANGDVNDVHNMLAVAKDTTGDVDFTTGDVTQVAPLSVKLLLTVFFYFYVGCELGYTGWISTYALATVTSNSAHAAYLVSAFYISFTIGRLAAVPISIYVSNMTMLRLQFLLSIIGCILAASIGDINYTLCLVSAVVLGYGFSSMFPLGLTIVNDYGFTVDNRSTTVCILGATMGECTLPLITGKLMGAFNVTVLPIAILVYMSVTFAIYCCMHFILCNERLIKRVHTFRSENNFSNNDEMLQPATLSTIIPGSRDDKEIIISPLWSSANTSSD